MEEAIVARLVRLLLECHRRKARRNVRNGSRIAGEPDEIGRKRREILFQDRRRVSFTIDADQHDTRGPQRPVTRFVQQLQFRQDGGTYVGAMGKPEEHEQGAPSRLESARPFPSWSVSVKSGMRLGDAITVTRSRTGSGTRASAAAAPRLQALARPAAAVTDARRDLHAATLSMVSHERPAYQPLA